MTPPGNLFTVLTFIAAPAVLTNASSVLALNTANRFGRVIDRSRVLAAELKSLDRADPLRAVRQHQLQRLRRRGQLLMRAQSAIYASLGSFVATAFVAVVGAALEEIGIGAARFVGGVGLVLGGIATAGLLFASAVIVSETRLALAGMREDVSPFGEPLPDKEPLQ